MARDKERFPDMTSPLGRGVFVHLNEPDTKFKAEGTYSVRLAVPRDEAQKLIDAIDKAMRENFEEQKKANAGVKGKKPAKAVVMADAPYCDGTDRDGEYDDTVWFNFKSIASGVNKEGKGWSRRPPCFDAKLNPIDLDSVPVWSGSKLYVRFYLDPYYTAKIGAGIALRIVATQVVELRSEGMEPAASGATFGFAATDGFDVADAPAKVESSDDATEGDEDDNGAEGFEAQAEDSGRDF